MAKADHFPLDEGRPKDRSRTDLPCAFCFILSVVCLCLIYSYSLFHGNTKRLTHPFDYSGRLCGIDPGVKDQPFVYYCGVQEWDGEFPKKLRYRAKTCVAECPTNASTLIPCLLKEFVNFTKLAGTVQKKITFLSTLNVEVTQTVTQQRAYPTVEFRGKYCVPESRNNQTLHEDLIDGPLRHASRMAIAVGSFKHAWPIILSVSVLAVGLGLAYLYVLRSFAGPLIFGSMCVGTGLMAITGLFFLLGIFMDPWNEDGKYQQLNPMFRSFYGGEAKAYSAMVGLGFIAAGVCTGFATYNCIEQIDESVGVIQAACDCIFSPGIGAYDLISQPLFEGLILLVLCAFMFWGFLLVCSVGYIDDVDIWIDSKPVVGLQKHFAYHKGWKLVIGLYIFCAFWILEVVLALGHFVVSYAVCLWYFVEIVEVDNPDEASKPFRDAYKRYGKHVDGVRVYGVDLANEERPGYIEKGAAGNVLVVPMGRERPDGRHFVEQGDTVCQKKMECGSVLQGCLVGFTYHLGSIALGSLVITLTRPLRWLSQMIKVFIGRAAENRGDAVEEDRTLSGLVVTGLQLVTQNLDEAVGGFSKNAYVDMVLSSTNFSQAGQDAYRFVQEAGGVVAVLHGSTALYEMISVLVITVTCGGLSFLLMTAIRPFSDPEGGLYVRDPWMMCVLAAAISCAIAFGFMSLFNNTADTLLYAYEWSRKWHAKDVDKYCPWSIKHLVGDEFDEGTPAALQPQGRNKMTRMAHAAERYSNTIAAYRTGAQNRTGQDPRGTF